VPERGKQTPAPALPPVLCYHKIESRREIGVTRLAPRRFARQMEGLARDGWRALSLDDLDRCARAEAPVPPRSVVITLDDAYRGLRTHAFPLLASLGFPAICAVITDYAGRLNRWDVAVGGRAFAHLAWRDIERWAGRGITFVSHSASHPRLTWLTAGAVAGELARSRDALQAVLGTHPRAVAYPFGAAGPRERSIARQEGYATGLHLVVRWYGDPMALPRTPVYPWSRGVPIPGALEHGIASIVTRMSIAASAWRALA
jgi:peptidoglycan/xylan/chitin deacetylase (PgdA/CDA1 family)